MSYVIGITGRSGSGKDTLANALVVAIKDAGTAAQVVGFAQPIRIIAARVGFDPFDREAKEKRVMFEWAVFRRLLSTAITAVLPNLTTTDHLLLYANTVSACVKFTIPAGGVGHWPCLEISPREFMQVLGTEGGQSLRKTLWVDAAAQTFKYNPISIVSDVRFEHELRVLDTLIVLHRSGLADVAPHVSEEFAARMLNSPDPSVEGVHVSHVYNNATLASLCAQARDLARDFASMGETYAQAD